MITLSEYFGPRLRHAEATPEMFSAADALLNRVNGLLERARKEAGYAEEIDPDTGTQVSGSKGGSGDGGFRSSDARTGAGKSKHKLARAVDVYDPGDVLDTWLNDVILATHGLYREHPDDTPGWCHLQDIAPGSGRRTFKP